MSGGFFRGTSADQDTRFSNKQAKLLKSQKFAPELEYLVDMRKVKMDVVRPWIANRVTELLGFEDEVLINFIFGLLDGKEVNGKEVQISLTGFMEKNTGKFMKELWSLLLSAQKNESGVPQQFLDAKAEETQKKQAEADRITHEIQKKKEKESRELEQERSRKMDCEAKSPAVEPTSKHMLPKDSTVYSTDGEETERNRMRGRSRHSSSESSRSPSNSRSYSGDRQSSRSVSRSPEGRRSPRKRSIVARRRHSPQVSPSPPRRRSSYSRRRSRSLSPYGSPLPVRRRMHSQFWRRLPSPTRRRSRSPIRRRRSPSPPRIRRSPSPDRRFRSRSPVQRHRSPSPVRRRSRSPLRRRSPSPRRRSLHPFRRRSPSLSPRRYQRSPSSPCLRSHSPVRHRSPVVTRRRSPPSSRRRSPSQSSPSPVHHRSNLPVRRRLPAQSGRRSVSPYKSSSLSPVQRRLPISAHRRSSSPSLYRSVSPYGSSSPSPVQKRSVSPVRRISHREQRRSPLQSPRVRARAQDKMSALQPTRGSLRSPVRVSKDRKDFNNKMPDSSLSPCRSPIHSESPPTARDRNRSEERRRLRSPYESPVHRRGGRTMRDDSPSSPQKPREQKPHHEVTDGARDDGREAMSPQKRSVYSSTVAKRKLSPVKFHQKYEQPHQSLGSQQATEFQSNTDGMEPRKIDQEMKSEKFSVRGGHPENSDGLKSLMYKKEVHKPDETHLHPNSPKDIDRRHKSESTPILADKVDHGNGGGRFDSGSELSDKPRAEKRRQKHKRSHRRELASDDSSYESEIDGRKEAKKRRKEEKKRRKEEKRRRREERRRKREERRAEKMKSRPHDASSSSDDEQDGKRLSHPSDDNDTQSEQKRLEIELRRKALESLKAKKGISH